MTGINVLDWTAGPFLTLYAALYLFCLVAGSVIVRRLRPDGHPGTIANAEEAAVLGPGRERLGEVIVARLIERKALTVAKGKLVPQPGARGQDAIESTILGLSAPIPWSKLRKVTDLHLGRVEQALVRRGLLLEKGPAMYLALVACLPLVGLLLLGLTKALVGSSRGHPVGFLILFMVVTVGTILFRWVAASRITRPGEAALAQARLQGNRLKLAPAYGEAGMAVALFGTGVLATGMMGDFHRMRASGDGGSGGGDSGSSDGGSGCGGGGCGGCGS